MQLIHLTGVLGKGLSVQVDDEDYEELSKYKWHLTLLKKVNKYYARRTVTYSIDKKQRFKSINMHRQIIGVTNSKIWIDHIDGNGLNNQRSNLREATPSQNAINKISKKTYKGVYKQQRVRKDNTILIYYMARTEMSINGKIIRKMKYCKTELEAALAYNEMATELHKEFANLNKI